MEPLIEAIGVGVSSMRDQRVQVSGVDWKIAAGDYWIVGGPHGSGKSNLLATAAGLHRPAAGCVRLFGQEITDMAEAKLLKLRTRIGFVFKNGGRMFPGMTVAENIGLPLCYHRNWKPEEAQAEVHALLELTGLDGAARETAQELGFEWTQRVGLARALALKPEVLFLDEPLEGLEFRQRTWWRNFLGTLATGPAKITIIASTNDFSLWQGERRLFACIKDKHWQLLGEPAEFPQIT